MDLFSKLIKSLFGSRKPQRIKSERKRESSPVKITVSPGKPQPIKDERNTEGSPVKSTISSGIRYQQEKIYIQVGIDFGTSTTKIAYSYLGGKGKRVHPLLFHHHLPHYPDYCLPTVAAFDPSSQLLLGIEAARYLADKPWDSGLRRFKILVAGKSVSSFSDEITENSYRNYLLDNGREQSQYKPEFLTSAFLAFAMRQARMNIQKDFPGCDLDLAFNICMPIDYLQSSSVKTVYEKIIATAAAIDTHYTEHTSSAELLEYARSSYEQTVYQPEDQKTRVFFIPESVAEIASYLASLQVREGIHAVIDFGAGTTDISIFNLKNARDWDSKVYWYAACNLPKGTQQIERILAEFIHNSLQTSIRENQIIDLLKDLNKIPQVFKERIQQALFDIWKSTHPIWGKAYSHCKKQTEWERDKVHVFVCGGGSKNPFVPKIFSESWMHRPGQDWGPYPLRTLPVPDDYDSLNGRVPFERLSVAYGLTIPKPELTEYVLPEDAPDHTPPPLPRIDIDARGSKYEK